MKLYILMLSFLSAIIAAIFYYNRKTQQIPIYTIKQAIMDANIALSADCGIQKGCLIN